MLVAGEAADREDGRTASSVLKIFVCRHDDCFIWSGIPSDAVLSYFDSRDGIRLLF